MASDYQPLHQDCAIYTELLYLYQQGRELVLYRDFEECGFLPWLNIRVIEAHENWNRAELFVYKPNVPFPQLTTRVTKCENHKLMLKGTMVYHHRKRPDKFKLTLRRNKSQPSRFDGYLDISGYTTIDLLVICGRAQYSTPERVFLKFEYNDPKVQNGDMILYKDIIGTFKGWHSKQTNQIRISYGEKTTYPTVNKCLVVFRRRIEGSRSIIQDDSSSDSDSSSSVTRCFAQLSIN